MKSNEKKEDYKERLKERFSQYIKSKKLRQTNERFAILEKVIDMNTHFDIDTIYKAMEIEYHVSRTTVYNTIDLLCECNIIRKHYIDGNQATFDLADSRHIHLICTCCGKIKEVSDTRIVDYVSGKKFRGFSPEFSSIYIYGICSKCKRKKNGNK